MNVRVVPPCKILRTILNMDNGGTQTNGTKNKEIVDDK